LYHARNVENCEMFPSSESDITIFTETPLVSNYVDLGLRASDKGPVDLLDLPVTFWLQHFHGKFHPLTPLKVPF